MGDSHGMTGNGVEMAKQVASKFGKSTTSTPTSGDIVSLQPNHVAIVSHVFDNGDILIVEQNVPNYSGNGDSFTWNYSYITKATQKAKNYEFWNPSSEGYKVTNKAKSVG